jgi:hypothetical protein
MPGSPGRGGKPVQRRALGRKLLPPAGSQQRCPRGAVHAPGRSAGQRARVGPVQVLHHQRRPPFRAERPQQVPDGAEQPDPVIRESGEASARWTTPGTRAATCGRTYGEHRPKARSRTGHPAGPVRPASASATAPRGNDWDSGRHAPASTRTSGATATASASSRVLPIPASPCHDGRSSRAGVAAQNPAEAVQLAAAADERRPRHVLR